MLWHAWTPKFMLKERSQTQRIYMLYEAEMATGIYSKWAKELFKMMNMFQNSVTLLQKSMTCTIIMGEFYSMYILPQ